MSLWKSEALQYICLVLGEDVKHFDCFLKQNFHYKYRFFNGSYPADFNVCPFSLDNEQFHTQGHIFHNPSSQQL